jgi:hypothetical protein
LLYFVVGVFVRVFDAASASAVISARNQNWSPIWMAGEPAFRRRLLKTRQTPFTARSLDAIMLIKSAVK